jgi:hypothetical protein
MEKVKSRPVSFLFLIPALILGIVSLALAIVGLGMIPLLPAIAGLVLAIASFLMFRESYKVFTKIVIGILLVAALISVFRSTVFKPSVANDNSFDSTMVKTQQGVDNDLEDAFGSDSVTVK